MSLAWAISLALSSIAPADPAPRGGAPSESAIEPDWDDTSALERAAQEAFAAGRYGDTVRFAARAFELTGDVRHLYAQAHAERFRGDCPAALGLYARVMAAEPSSELGDLARRGVELCEEATPSPEPQPQPDAEPEPEAPPPEPAAVTTTPPPPRDGGKPQHWIRDPLGGALLGTGIVAIAVGAGLWVQSAADLRASDRADDEAEFADARQRARGFRIGAIVAFSAGGALVTGAAVRYGLVGKKRQRAAVSLQPARGRGFVLGVSGRF